jgi:subtilisin family serine protease
MKVAIAAAAGGLLLFCASAVALAGDTDVIVGFKGGADAKVIEQHGGKAGEVLAGIGAVAGRVPASAISDLRADASVAYVEEDGVVEALGKGTGSAAPTPSQPAQSTPWGITRVGAPVSGNTGSGIKVAIIDTGIDLTHPDLAANIHTGVNFVNSAKTPDDDNGHGSHVSGIVAAANNTIGVVGVASNASLYPVKVLDRRGSGTWSAVAAGITWAADNGMQVANMSLGGGASTTAENACSYAEGVGVLLVAAAGNSGDGSTSTEELSYPAAYSTVVAVGATDGNDNLASFSNTGSFVEVSGPGVNVYSTYKDAGYATLSGTSMASPHAAGMAALLWWEQQQTSTPTVSSVRAALDSRVRDLGPTGRDAGYGYGVVYFP